jgi:hypothetical protein
MTGRSEPSPFRAPLAAVALLPLVAGRCSAHMDGRMTTPPAADAMRIFDPGELQAIVPRDHH